MFSPELTILQVVTPEVTTNNFLSVAMAQLNCCIPVLETILLGSEHGILYCFSDQENSLPARMDPVRTYGTSRIFCLCVDAHDSLLFVGLETGVDVVAVGTFACIYLIPFPDSVWSISMRPGSDDILVGLQYSGIVIVELDAESARRRDLATEEISCFHKIKCQWLEVGTSSAISQGPHGSWYAASNRSRIYYCRAAGELDSRHVARAVFDLGDYSGIPKRDIYDVLVISGLSDVQSFMKTKQLPLDSSVSAKRPI